MEKTKWYFWGAVFIIMMSVICIASSIIYILTM